MSCVAAEFNIARHLKPGPNLLAVEVYRWSDGSFVEDQDMWRMSRIFRDVCLWSAARRHIRDFHRRRPVGGLLDLAQMGVGGIDSWSPNACPMEPYRIAGDRPHTYKYRLLPVTK